MQWFWFYSHRNETPRDSLGADEGGKSGKMDFNRCSCNIWQRELLLWKQLMNSWLTSWWRWKESHGGFCRPCHSGCNQNTLAFPSCLHVLRTAGPPARLGGPSGPAGVPSSGAARSGPRCEQRQLTSTNQRTRSVLSLTEALCVGEGDSDGGGQLSDDICIEHEMCKDVAFRLEVGVHVHIPRCRGAAAAASASPGEAEQPAEQRSPEEDVDPGVQDGIHGSDPDGSQVSFVVIHQLEVVGKHLYLKRK